MIPSPTDTGADEAPAREQADRSNREQLAFIRTELSQLRADIRDDELREAVTEWLLRAQDVPAADTDDYVSSKLARLRRDHAMYVQPGHGDAEEAFPDACKGCPHYGTACPIVTDNTQITRRERIMDEATSAKDLRNSLRDYAIDNHCSVLLDVIRDLSEHHEPLLKRGQALLMAVEESVLFENDEAVDRLKDQLESLADGTLGDGPALDDLLDGDAESADAGSGRDGSATSAEAVPDGGIDEAADDGFEFVTAADLRDDGGQ